MEPLSNSDGHVQDDALKPGAELKDGVTVVVGCDGHAKPLIAKGAHVDDEIIGDFIAEFRRMGSIEKIIIGDYDAENVPHRMSRRDCLSHKWRPHLSATRESTTPRSRSNGG